MDIPCILLRYFKEQTNFLVLKTINYQFNFFDVNQKNNQFPKPNQKIDQQQQQHNQNRVMSTQQYNQYMGNLFSRSKFQTSNFEQNKQNIQNQDKFIFDIHRMVKIKNQNVRNQYLINNTAIGEGAFGKVFKASHKSTKIIRSVKVVKKRTSNQLLEEYQILRQLDHPNILKLYEIYIENSSYSLVTDYYQGGSIRQKIKKLGKANQLMVARYMEQILMALTYIHSKGFMHCDLKPDNILLDKSHKLIKLIDFGMSRRITDNRCAPKSIGTHSYNAPEISQGTVLSKSDIWSCGVILIVMLSGRIPRYQQLHSGKFQLDVDFSQLISSRVKNLIYQMINHNVSKRPTAKQALNHEWFKWHRHLRYLDVDIVDIQKCLCNMKQYLKYNRLQALFISIIANFILTQEDKLIPTEIFLQCDKDNDGVISVVQLNSVISHVCPKRFKSVCINKVFLQLDKNQSNSIDLRQFLACTIDPNIILHPKHIQQVFIQIDSDGDDKVSIEEFINYVNYLVPLSGINKQMIVNLDKDQDGFIGLQQFTMALNQRV